MVEPPLALLVDIAAVRRRRTDREKAGEGLRTPGGGGDHDLPEPRLSSRMIDEHSVRQATLGTAGRRSMNTARLGVRPSARGHRTRDWACFASWSGSLSGKLQHAQSDAGGLWSLRCCASTHIYWNLP